MFNHQPFSPVIAKQSNNINLEAKAFSFPSVVFDETDGRGVVRCVCLVQQLILVCFSLKLLDEEM